MTADWPILKVFLINIIWQLNIDIKEYFKLQLKSTTDVSFQINDIGKLFDDLNYRPFMRISATKTTKIRKKKISMKEGQECQLT